MTDRHFVTFGGRFGCRRRTNGAEKRHAGHRNTGNRSSKYHWVLHAIALCVTQCEAHKSARVVQMLSLLGFVFASSQLSFPESFCAF